MFTLVCILGYNFVNNINLVLGSNRFFSIKNLLFLAIVIYFWLYSNTNGLPALFHSLSIFKESEAELVAEFLHHWKRFWVDWRPSHIVEVEKNIANLLATGILLDNREKPELLLLLYEIYITVQSFFLIKLRRNDRIWWRFHSLRFEFFGSFRKPFRDLKNSHIFKVGRE